MTNITSLAPQVSPIFGRVKCHDVLVLRRARLTHRELAHRSEVSLRIVKRIARLGGVDPPP